MEKPTCVWIHHNKEGAVTGVEVRKSDTQPVEYPLPNLQKALSELGSSIAFWDSKEGMQLMVAMGLNPPQLPHDLELLLFLRAPLSEDLSLSSAISELGLSAGLSPTEAMAMVFQQLIDYVQVSEQVTAYQRGRELIPVLMEMERQRIQLDRVALAIDLPKYEEALEETEAWIRRRMRASSSLNIDSHALFMQQLKSQFPLPANCTKLKDAYPLIEDQYLVAMIRYRGALNTSVRTFMRNWSTQSDGIATCWRPVKGTSHGAKTGRMSSSPNFQNIPKAREQFTLPLSWLPKLPNLRSYIIPRPGYVLLDRDYSQQELRILAHYIKGWLLDQYREDPWLDIHSQVTKKLEGRYTRDYIKATTFGILYGMGIPKLAETLGISNTEASAIKRDVLQIYTGLSELSKNLRKAQQFSTWGGRRYTSKGTKNFVNYLIQGSAADCTKEAMIRFHNAKDPRTHILLAVHDQLTVEAPEEIAATEMAKLKSCMEGVQFNTDMLTTGNISITHYADLKPFEDH